MNLANTGIAFITCLLLGAGIGLLLGNLEAGGAIGFGAGLIFVAVFRKK